MVDTMYQLVLAAGGVGVGGGERDRRWGKGGEIQRGGGGQGRGRSRGGWGKNEGVLGHWGEEWGKEEVGGGRDGGGGGVCRVRDRDKRAKGRRPQPGRRLQQVLLTKV